MMNLLRFTFLPQSTDLGLLVLRLYLGLSMLVLHGWGKLLKFQSASPTFQSPIPQLPSQVAYGLVVFAEVGCSVLLIFGLLTRFASLTLIINMSVAWVVVHQMQLSGPKSGELAFLYLGGFVVLFIAGAGRISADRR
jgi:putative oxidoreductase